MVDEQFVIIKLKDNEELVYNPKIWKIFIFNWFIKAYDTKIILITPAISNSLIASSNIPFLTNSSAAKLAAVSTLNWIPSNWSNNPLDRVPFGCILPNIRSYSFDSIAKSATETKNKFLPSGSFKFLRRKQKLRNLAYLNSQNKVYKY